jgi:hypothetical protein
VSNRKALAARKGERFRVTATVKRFSQKNGWKGQTVRTVLLTDVRDINGNSQLTDHLWFRAGVWSIPLREGDRIAFDARATLYNKGYRGRRADAWDAPPPSTDWRLEYPSAVKVIARKIRERTGAVRVPAPRRGPPRSGSVTVRLVVNTTLAGVKENR